ncbi:MAG: glucosamine-6-phosphate deaminase [Pseudorhodobacter sp.]
MQIRIFDDRTELGRAAATEGAAAIRASIEEKGTATIIVATGASQFEMLTALVAEDLDWGKVTAFHLDEYIGLPETHPASFRGYLRDRFVNLVDGLGEFVPVNGDAADSTAVLASLNTRIAQEEIAVCFAGFGENCHLAFNDPPADFDAKDPYIEVALDEACRRQQMGEGWFPTLEDVPQRAISMSIPQMMKARKIVITAPDERKAKAVAAALEGPVSNLAPGSILQEHGDCSVYLDRASASLLRHQG